MKLFAKETVYIVFGGFAGYALLSSFARKYPEYFHDLTHKASDEMLGGLFSGSKPLNVAHRAGGGEAPENTIAAMRLANKAGAQLLQVDATLSKNEVALMIHDEAEENTLRRLTGREANIRDCLTSQVPPLLPQYQPSSVCGRCDTLEVGPFGADARICTLEEFLQASGSTPLQLELWDDDMALIRQVADLIQSNSCQDSVVVGHPFNQSINDKCQELMPHLPQILALGGIIEIYILYYTGLLPFVSLPDNRIFNCIQLSPGMMHIMLKVLEKKHGRPPSQLARQGMKLVGWLLKAPRLFKHLRQRGVPTIAFVMNGEEDWRYAVECGAQGIMTDFPSKLTQWLQS